jgi:prepilin-type N-terminal cleavage/methylation domain-containing protein
MHRIRAERSRGFTLVEMLVTVCIVSVLAGIVLAATMHTRAQTRALTCQTNQKAIAEAMLAFYSDRGEFPPDGEGANLALALADYIPWEPSARDVALPEVWRCPNDRSGRRVNSYERFYVQRVRPVGSEYFVLGCPRHDDTDSSYINLRGIQDAGRAPAASVTVLSPSGAADLPDLPIGAGALEFEDGSTARVKEAGTGHAMKALASFRNADGTLYTIVRLSGAGKAEFTVTPGSQFEVVTPVAIIGVRGTTFDVETRDGYAKITCTGGKVVVDDKLTGAIHELSAGDWVEIGATGVPTSQYDPLSLAHHTGTQWKITNPNAIDVACKWVHIDASTGAIDWTTSGSVYADPNTDTVFDAGYDLAKIRIYYQLPDRDGEWLYDDAVRPGGEED